MEVGKNLLDLFGAENFALHTLRQQIADNIHAALDFFVIEVNQYARETLGSDFLGNTGTHVAGANHGELLNVVLTHDIGASTWRGGAYSSGAAVFPRAMIHLQHIKKSYPSEADSGLILGFEDWQVEAGGQVALIGESGSGKTTLLNLLSGLVQPDCGVVSIDGVDLARLSEAKRDRFRADNVGYVFQSFHLLDGYSVQENVELGAVFAKGHHQPGRAVELLEGVGLGHRLQHTPQQLSVGQQARVAFARALMNRPKLLLADEPTGALDHENGKQVLSMLLETARESGITVVCATHDMEVAAAFDTITRVEDLR